MVAMSRTFNPVNAREESSPASTVVQYPLSYFEA
jgi:hypothetical protein